MRTGHGPPVCTARRLPELRLPPRCHAPHVVAMPPLPLGGVPRRPGRALPGMALLPYLSSSGTAASSSGSISSCSVWNARGADTTADVAMATEQLGYW